MAYINSVLIQGNLVRDPESNQLPSGAQVCSFTVAINRSYLKRDGTWQNDVSYLDCEIWGTEAQRCMGELKKGCLTKVLGRLRQDRWQDKEGRTHSRIKIVVEHFEKQSLPQQQDPEKAIAEAEAMHQTVQNQKTTAE